MVFECFCLRPGFMVLGWFVTMVFVRFYPKQAFHGGVHKDMVFLRLLLPWPGHPWTPWVEPHFRYSDWPQIPYVNMTLFPLGIVPNASNCPRTLFRPRHGPALEQYDFVRSGHTTRSPNRMVFIWFWWDGFFTVFDFRIL